MIRMLGIMLCAWLPAHAQNAPAASSKETLLSVQFGGPSQHEVELDGYGTCLKAHWVSNRVEGGLAAANHPYVSPAMPEYYNRHGAPVAYVRGATPQLTARFLAPADTDPPTQVVGEVTAQFHIGLDKPVAYHTQLSGTAKLVDGEWVATNLVCEQPLPDRIGYAEAFTIRWSLIHTDGQTREAGVSCVPLYLLRETPLDQMPLLHTPVNLACRGAVGLEDDAAILAAVWQPFAQKHVTRAWDNQPLAYYGANHSTASEMRGLLVAGTGQCTTWAYLMHLSLGAHGIESDITMVMPSSAKGGILVHRHAFLHGTTFVSSGPNGICETTAAGDDDQAIAVGCGRPNTRAVEAIPAEFPSEEIQGDDLVRGTSWGAYLLTGPDGIVQTRLDPERFLPVVPLGFGVAQQRGYQITDTAAEIQLSGDDSLVRDAKGNGWVLTGPNGILETLPHDGMKSAAGGRVSVSHGKGSAGLNLHTHLPIHRLAQTPRTSGGDDVVHDQAWISTGENGIVETPALDGETQVMPPGTGAPNVPVIGPGPDGVLQTKPAGDDTILDLTAQFKLAGPDYPYLLNVNIWPLEGVPGQQTRNPPPGFPNHVILKVGEALYDPSYGTGPFPDHETWEKASLAGMTTGLEDADGKRIGGKARRAGRLSYQLKLLPPY